MPPHIANKSAASVGAFFESRSTAVLRKRFMMAAAFSIEFSCLLLSFLVPGGLNVPSAR
jgi:hypothetical protein